MPFIVFVYCLFVRGLIFNGRAGIFYALQRLIAEAILALMLVELRLRKEPGTHSGSVLNFDDHEVPHNPVDERTLGARPGEANSD
jgi:hypothetical protein